MALVCSSLVLLEWTYRNDYGIVISSKYKNKEIQKEKPYHYRITFLLEVYK